MVNTNDKIKITDLPIEKVLEVVLKPIMINFGVCFVLLIAVSVPYFWGIPDLKNRNFTSFLCSLNTCFLSPAEYGVIVAGLVVLMIVTFIIIMASRLSPRIKFTLLILSGLLILFTLIYLSGGILDSPFTGALGVYISSYFIIQERGDLNKINKVVLLFVVLLAVAPYVWMVATECQQHIIHWNDNRGINSGRVLVTIALIGFAGYHSNRVSKDLTEEFNRYNKLQKEIYELE